jgi:hypothetical protein
MTVQVILPAAYRVMPWRNGTGKTAEVAIAPGAGDRYVWRISIADVPESGPFSDYAGYERIISVVEGAGMEFHVAGHKPARLTRDSKPYAFPGSVATRCTLLDGPIRDFNLMYDPVLVRGRVRLVRRTRQPFSTKLKGETVLIFARDGELRIDVPHSGAQSLPAGATLRLDNLSGPLSIDGTALLVTID